MSEVTLQVEGVIFVRQFSGFEGQEVTDKWVGEDPDNLGQSFELTRQVVQLDEDEEDATWGVWSTEADDWAHEPAETGFATRREALNAFRAWQLG